MAHATDRPIPNASNIYSNSVTKEKANGPQSLIGKILHINRMVSGDGAAPAADAENLSRSSHRPVGLRKAAAPQPVGGIAKRTCDIIIASLALVLMAPIMIIIAVLIRLTMGGPVIFIQQRVGHNGASFPCYKFRTMTTDAQERLKRYLALNPEAARQWQQKQKLRRDPRVTSLGHMLRKSSLDELPQLLNILRGDMSCIGPRPVVASELERYGEHAADYMKARPGMTGLWQVSGRSSTGYAERIKLDRYYVRRWSLWLDFVILLRTIPALIRIDDTA